MKKLITYFFISLSIVSIQTSFSMQSELSLIASLYNTGISTSNIMKPLTNINAIKGLHDGINPTYYHLSPINGILLTKSKFIENLYHFGNPDHTTHKVTKTLFHKLGNQFRASQYVPAATISPLVAGNIVGSIESGTLEKNNAAKKDLIRQWEIEHYKKSNLSFYSVEAKKILRKMEGAANECSTQNQQAIYMPGVFQSLIVGFLAEKPGATKQDILDYLKTVNEHIPVLKESSNIQGLLQQEYTNDDIQAHIAQMEQLDSEQIAQAITSNHYEQAAHAVLAHKLTQSALPAKVIQRRTSYLNNPSVPDCMESTMRTVCYWLLSNFKESHTNFEVLPEDIQKNLPADIKEYFKQYGRFSQINSPEASHAWMNLISNRPNICYNRNKYELKPTAENFLTLLNQLFNTNASSIQDFGRLLNTSGRKISFEQKKDNHGLIDIRIDNNALQVMLSSIHADIEIPCKKNNRLYHSNKKVDHARYELSPEEELNFALKKMHQTTSNIASSYLLSHHLLETDGDNSSDYKPSMHTLLSLPNLEDPNVLLRQITRIILNLSNSNIKEQSKFIDSIIHLLPHIPQDEHFLREIGNCIGRKKAYISDPRIESFLKKHPKALLEAIYGLISAKEPDISKIYEWIKEFQFMSNENEIEGIGAALGSQLIFEESIQELIRKNPIELANQIVNSIISDKNNDPDIDAKILREISFLPTEQQFTCLERYVNKTSNLFANDLCEYYKKYPSLIKVALRWTRFNNSSSKEIDAIHQIIEFTPGNNNIEKAKFLCEGRVYRQPIIRNFIKNTFSNELTSDQAFEIGTIIGEKIQTFKYEECRELFTIIYQKLSWQDKCKFIATIPSSDYGLPFNYDSLTTQEKFWQCLKLYKYYINHLKTRDLA